MNIRRIALMILLLNGLNLPAQNANDSTFQIDGKVYKVFPYQIDGWLDAADFRFYPGRQIIAKKLLPPPIIKPLSDGDYVIFAKYEHGMEEKSERKIVRVTCRIRNGSFNGPIVHFKNDKPIIKGFLRNNKKDSTWVSVGYLHNPEVIRARFKNNMLNGLAEIYSAFEENAAQWEKGTFQSIKFRKKIRQTDSMYFVNNQLHGVYKRYRSKKQTYAYTYDSGKLVRSIRYFNSGGFFKTSNWNPLKLPRSRIDSAYWLLVSEEKVDTVETYYYQLYKRNKLFLEVWHQPHYRGMDNSGRPSDTLHFADGRHEGLLTLNLDELDDEKFFKLIVDRSNLPFKDLGSLTAKYHYRDSVFEKHYLHGYPEFHSQFNLGNYQFQSKQIVKNGNRFILDTLVFPGGRECRLSKVHSNYIELVRKSEWDQKKEKSVYLRDPEYYDIYQDDGVVLDWDTVSTTVDEKYKASKRERYSKSRRPDNKPQSISELKRGLITHEVLHVPSGQLFELYTIKYGKNKFVNLNSVELVKSDSHRIQFRVKSIIDLDSNLILEEDIYVPYKGKGKKYNFCTDYFWQRSVSRLIYQEYQRLDAMEIADSLYFKFFYKGKEFKGNVHFKNKDELKKFNVKLTYHPPLKTRWILGKERVDVKHNFSKFFHKGRYSNERVMDYYYEKKSRNRLDFNSTGTYSFTISSWVTDVNYRHHKKQGRYYGGRSVEYIYFKDGVVQNFVQYNGYGGDELKLVEFRNGKPNGSYIQYNASQERVALGSLKDGLPHGSYCTFWGPDTARIEHYREGVVDGLFKANQRVYVTESQTGLSESVKSTQAIGEPQYEIYLKYKGNAQGGQLTWLNTYHNNGRLHQKIIMLDTFRLGYYRYRTSMNFKKDYIYRRGKLSQVGRIAYDPRGYESNSKTNTVEFVNYHSSLWSGTHSSLQNAQCKWANYFKHGTLASEGIYKEADKLGAWKYYYPDGDTFQIVEYFKKDTNINQTRVWGKVDMYSNSLRLMYKGFVLEKEHVLDCNQDAEVDMIVPYITHMYDSLGQPVDKDSFWLQIPFTDGSIYASGYMVNGLPQGVWQFFGKNGALVEFGSYMQGKREGTWLKGDLTGVHIDQSVCLDEELMETMLADLANITLIRMEYVDGHLQNQESYDLSR